MSFGRCDALVLLLCLGLSGCSPTAESQMDEQKNPHFQAGKEKLGALDYNGAIECFERALEDNLLQRIPACRQELIKADSLAIVNPSALRETVQLREENQALRQQIETLRAQLAARPAGMSGPGLSSGPASAAREMLRSVPARPSNNPALSGWEAGRAGRPMTVLASEQTRATAGTGARWRTHPVKAGETLASVARLYQIKLSALQAANPGLDPKRVKVGSLLNIPAS